MTQMKTFSWTNPAAAVARNLDCGFDVAEVTTIDITNGGSFYWMDTMDDASYLDVDAGTITATNGFTALAQSTIVAGTITAFSNANPGVISATSVAALGIAAGDTIKVTALADDQTATTLNGTYTVASVTATTVTTATNTAAYSVYVSGGRVSRVSDSTGKPVPTENVAVRGVTVGSDVVGANNAVMVAICKSSEHVL